MERLKWGAPWLLFFLSAAGYLLFAVDIQRSEHVYLFTTFLGLVLFAFALHRLIRQKSWWILFVFGLVFRGVFLLATPHLSDDYFRFTWDGELTKDGYSAFAFIPNDYADHVLPEHQEKYSALLKAHSDEFPTGMNSRNYYSIYPAVNQFVFYTAALGGDPNGTNLILLRLWLLIGEIVTFLVLKVLLNSQHQSTVLGLYWLHPLVIIELIGNLHFEAMAITFTVLALYFAWKNKWIGVAISTALAIMSKLTPLFILAALYKKQPLKTWLITGTVTGLLTVLLLATILNTETFVNFKGSFGLFFAHFSFNAGLYYGLIDIASLITWRSMAAYFSLFFPFITMGLFFYLTFIRKQDLYTTLLLLFTTYFVFSPIVHPWYVTILIPLALLSRKIYPIVWSLLIFGTYFAYREPFAHPFLWIYFEYAVVFTLLFFEFRSARNWSHRLADHIFAPATETAK